MGWKGLARTVSSLTSLTSCTSYGDIDLHRPTSGVFDCAVLCARDDQNCLSATYSYLTGFCSLKNTIYPSTSADINVCSIDYDQADSPDYG